jgi:hypothetical protein
MTKAQYKEFAIKCYLDWWCDFLTIARYAEYYDITELKAEKIINRGRKLYNQ